VTDQNVRRWAGAFGVAGFVVFLIALPLYFVGAQPVARLEDTVAFSDSVRAARNTILLRTTIADPLIFAGWVVFLAGFCNQVRRARPEYEWIAALVFGAGLIVITLELAGDAFQAGAALETFAMGDPSADRGLWAASFVFYGAIGLITSALLLASAGYATLATGVLPKWTGWFACASAVANLAAAPSIFGGTDYTRFYSAPGYVTFIAQAAMALWFLVASISMIRKPLPEAGD